MIFLNCYICDWYICYWKFMLIRINIIYQRLC